GNGIVEYPEWCDGESFCASNCTIDRYACCQFATGSGGCSNDVPAYTLFAYQYQVCGTYGGTFERGLTGPAGPAPAAPPRERVGPDRGRLRRAAPTRGADQPLLPRPIRAGLRRCLDGVQQRHHAVHLELRLQELPGHPDRARYVRRRRSLRVRSLIRPAA